MKDSNYDFLSRHYSLFNMLDKVRFYKAIWSNNDELLNAKLEDTFLTLADAVKDKHIAVVGNARSLCTTSYGRAIDSKDIVIRINRAPMFSEFSHGTKTDWLALATTIEKKHFESLSTKKLIWMSHKRKRLKQWMMEKPLYLFPQELYAEIKQSIGAPPSTGLMMLYWLSKTSFASLNIYGFDFFKSLSLTGSRTEDQVPHDFKAEQDWFNSIKNSSNNIYFYN